MLENFNTERTLYSSIQKKKRVIIPKIFTLISLSIIFYIGVLLVISLLKLEASQETTFKISTLIFLILIVFLGIFLSHKHSKKRYIFYKDRIFFNKKEIRYVDINKVINKQNIWDKMFKTYSLKLSKNFSIRHISKEIELKSYTKEMVRYAKGNHLIETY